MRGARSVQSTERVVRCGKPDCPMIISGPRKMNYARFLSALRQQGWQYRGSQNGHLFRCPRHVWTKEGTT